MRIVPQLANLDSESVQVFLCLVSPGSYHTSICTKRFLAFAFVGFSGHRQCSMEKPSQNHGIMQTQKSKSNFSYLLFIPFIRALCQLKGNVTLRTFACVRILSTLSLSDVMQWIFSSFCSKHDARATVPVIIITLCRSW